MKSRASSFRAGNILIKTTEWREIGADEPLALCACRFDGNQSVHAFFPFLITLKEGIYEAAVEKKRCALNFCVTMITTISLPAYPHTQSDFNTAEH